MYDLVGEQIRESSMQGSSSGCSTAERDDQLPVRGRAGVRFRSEPIPLGGGLTSMVIQTRQPCARDKTEAKDSGAVVSGETRPSRGWAFRSSPAKTLGVISLESLRRMHSRIR